MVFDNCSIIYFKIMPTLDFLKNTSPAFRAVTQACLLNRSHFGMCSVHWTFMLSVRWMYQMEMWTLKSLHCVPD